MGAPRCVDRRSLASCAGSARPGIHGRGELIPVAGQDTVTVLLRRAAFWSGGGTRLLRQKRLELDGEGVVRDQPKLMVTREGVRGLIK
ncbi:hypothetical protein GCM10011578_096100 [Streptomyces fuscichromogenes]|uniref:Uncharacterized protein n=1 Tax=Streptomyces fuscichromogenes TaxID=1324013 RepID=A0A917XQ37_9ACTN|nr:hypothetical protein GCM10011578_096100 [Streptomyces fuscichromogenes]